MVRPIAKVQTQSRELNQAQDNIIKALRPLLSEPLVNGVHLPGVSLVNGTTQVTHKLGRVLQGWILTRVKGPATIYDQQDSNQTPALNLTLVSSAAVVVDLYVY